MKTSRLCIGLSLLFLISGCGIPEDPASSESQMPNEAFYSKTDPHITGSVEVVRLGNGNGQQPDRRMFAEFNGHEASRNNPAHGEFIYSVTDDDSALTLHRQITVEISDVFVDETTSKGWMVGIVISDTKGCSGLPGGPGGHTDECEGSGCSGDDSGGHTDECSGHDGGHDSGCTGDDGDDHGDGCAGSGGMGGQGGSGGHGISGKNCRLGQILAVKVHDITSPGSAGDGITWKWFDPEDERVAALDISSVDTWPHLCKKSIIEGNVVVHF